MLAYSQTTSTLESLLYTRYCGRDKDCSNEYGIVYTEMRKKETTFKELKEIQFCWSTEFKKKGGRRQGRRCRQRPNHALCAPF